jgi:hypothetical protein
VITVLASDFELPGFPTWFNCVKIIIFVTYVTAKKQVSVPGNDFQVTLK